MTDHELIDVLRPYVRANAEAFRIVQQRRDAFFATLYTRWEAERYDA